jgi:hypothetical protein
MTSLTKTRRNPRVSKIRELFRQKCVWLLLLAILHSRPHFDGGTDAIAALASPRQAELDRTKSQVAARKIEKCTATKKL